MHRMADKIRRLCGQILATKDDRDLTPIAVELRQALHQHIENLRVHLADYPLIVERRVRNGVPRSDSPTPPRETRPASTGQPQKQDNPAKS